MSKNPSPLLFWNPKKSFLSPLKNKQFIYCQKLNNRGGRNAVFFLGREHNKAAIVPKKKLCRKKRFSVFRNIRFLFQIRKGKNKAVISNLSILAWLGVTKTSVRHFFPWLVTLSSNFAKTLKFDGGGNLRGALLTKIRKIWSKAQVKALSLTNVVRNYQS